MNWANPWMLFALALPVAAAWLLRTRGLTSKPLWPRMSRVSIAANDRVRLETPRKRNPTYFILVAVGLGVIALARPQWGERAEQSFSQSVEVIIAMDLSRSMWTQDMPNQGARLSAAKTLVEQILDALRGENVGLVVFAGTSFVQVPMSPDYQIIRKFLPTLGPNSMPVGGTDYDSMLGSALEGFSQAEHRDRYLIVLSDGEETRPGLEHRIPELLRRRVHVIGIGFGTEQGALIPGRSDAVVSRLTPATLQTLATRTEGRYVPAETLANASAARSLIEDTVESGSSGRVRSANVVMGVDRFQWFLVPAVLVSWLSLVWEFQRHPRPRTLRRAAAASTALVMFVALFAPLRLQAHHDSEAGFEISEVFAEDPAQRVRAIVTHMGRFGYDPFDLQLQVQAAMQFAMNERAHGRLPLEGVMHDAVEAVRKGRQLSPARAPWDRYESQIHALFEPLPVEALAKDPEYDVEEEDQDDEQFYRPVPLRMAKDKEGRDLFGRNTRSRSEFALGDLSGDETFAPQEPHGGRRPPPKPPQSAGVTPEAAAANDPAIVEARRNFAIIVKADSPGRVHQLLNGQLLDDEGRRAVEKDW